MGQLAEAVLAATAWSRPESRSRIFTIKVEIFLLLGATPSKLFKTGFYSQIAETVKMANDLPCRSSRDVPYERRSD
jgi:hypothetical protein